MRGFTSAKSMDMDLVFQEKERMDKLERLSDKQGDLIIVSMVKDLLQDCVILALAPPSLYIGWVRV